MNIQNSELNRPPFSLKITCLGDFTHSNRNRIIQWRRRYIEIYEAKVWPYEESSLQGTDCHNVTQHIRLFKPTVHSWKAMGMCAYTLLRSIKTGILSCVKSPAGNNPYPCDYSGSELGENTQPKQLGLDPILQSVWGLR